MWIATRYGFISIVKRPGKIEYALDMQIRARDRKTLTNLQRAFPYIAIAELPIIRTNKADYRYRIFASRTQVHDLMDALTNDITYDNFKNAVPDDRLHDLYLSIWWAVYKHYDGKRK